MTKRFLLSAATALALLSPVSLPAFAQDTQVTGMENHPEGMHIHDVYARSNGGVGASGAVFFMVHNNTESDDMLIGAASDVAEKVELHTHIADANGVMQMRKIEGGIALPMGEMHELARGGDHVMLMGLTRELNDGETFPLTLTFEKAGDIVVEATVDNARKPGAGGMGQMDHGGAGHDHGAMHGQMHGQSSN